MHSKINEDGKWVVYVANKNGTALASEGGLDVITFPSPKANGGELVNGQVKYYGGMNPAPVDMVYDPVGDRLWLVSMSSLAYLDEEADTLMTPASTNGMLGAEFTSIDVDSHGNLWVGTTNQGVYRLSPKNGSPDTLKILHFTTKDGLLDNNVADLAIKYKAQKFVMISTDKAVNPTNVMGATKRMAEIYIQSRSNDTTHFVTTRFGNVLGSNGSVIPLFKKQLASGGPLTVTHKDIIRYFMTIPEACNLVLEAGAMGEGGDIFVFDMGKPVKIYDMARKMIQLSGMQNIEIKEIGLRPGEKLYEELLATKENNIPTYHPKIMRAQVRRYPLDAIDTAYNELWDILEGMDNMKIVGKMKAIVPEFLSNNSIYCQLDKPQHA